jgi:hypothetical protein
MAKGKPQSHRPYVQYLNVDITTKSQRELFMKWLEVAQDYYDMLEKAIDSGLKFGASWDNYNSCFQAQFTKLPGDNEGGTTMVLVGRGGDLTQAIQALVYKYYIVLEENLEDLDIKNTRGKTDWS